MNIIKSLALGIGVALLLADTVHAATRRVYFAQSGRNMTTNGLAPSDHPVSVCKITITNTSGQDQRYYFEPNVTASGPSAGTTNATPSGDPAGSSGALETIAANATKTLIYTYDAYPPSVVGAQELLCAGSITASDPTSTPGFVVANGVIVTFVESGALQTNGTTVGTTFGGMVIFSQVPISINGGRPF